MPDTMAPATAAPKRRPSQKKSVIRAIKGFERDMTCRGFKFEIGKSYRHEGEVEICQRGFHAIEGYPLDVFRYYPAASSLYADVELSGSISRAPDSDSKVAAANLRVGAALSLPDLIERAVQWVFDRSKPEGAASATGRLGAASATGERGAASATGTRGAASATGDLGAASATGDHGAAMAPGYDGRVMGADGNALFLARRNYEGRITHVWAGIAGRDGIKPNVWYCLSKNGTPEEVNNA